MRTLQKSSLALVALLLLPGLALATHMTDININGDCAGWTAAVDVHFRSTVYQADLDFEIILLNDQGEELERVTHAVQVGRDPAAGPDAVYYFDGAWEGYFESSYFVVQGNFHIYAPWGYKDRYLDEETKQVDFRLECTVPTDDTTWDRVKSLYR